MSWADVGQIATAAILSAGGIGAIIVGAVHFSANQIADRISKKYEAKLAQETEKYKTELSKKEYVSKTRFDAEFQIYRDLSIAFFDLVKVVNALIPYGLTTKPADEELQEQQQDKQLREAVSLSIEAQDILNKNAPFIAEQFYYSYNEILKMCYLQIDVIQDKYNVLNMCPDKGIPKYEDYSRTKEINERFRENNNNVRKYLALLEVLE